MATSTIPSPSAFVDTPVIQAASTSKAFVRNAAKKQLCPSKGHKSSRKLGNATTKPKQTKSRDGCKSCKEKRLKCDETKPTCVQCEKKGIICKGYEKVLKWRPQEETFRNKKGPPRSRKNPTTSKTARQQPPSPVPSNISHSSTDNDPAAPLDQPPIPLEPPLSQQTSWGDDDHASRHSENGPAQFNVQPIRLVAEGSTTSSTPSLVDSSYDENTTPQSARIVDSSLLLNNGPRTSKSLSPEIDFENPPPGYMGYQLEGAPATQLLYGLPALESLPSCDEETVEEIIRQQDLAHPWLVPMASPSSSDSSGSLGSFWIEAFAASMWACPRMPEDGEEALILRFDKQTCGILSIKNGPSENPWRTMLWPLAREEGALRHAIASLTAFHASKENPKLRIKGMEHMDHSLQLLSRGIKSMPLTTSLATTLVLAFCESWDMLITTGIRHLRGASHLIAEIMANYRLSQTLPENEPCLGFLCRTWVYMDVIARLTSLDGDNSTDFDIVGTSLCQPSMINHELDPLMGCASTLFPTIGRVANLVREVRQRTHSNSLQIISWARDLKSCLDKWRPPSMFAAPEDQWTEVEQGLWTAEAYRGATLLYLLQAVPEISYDSVTETIATLAKDVLTHIANVPVTSGMVIIHIFPLLAAGCEATDEESRTFVVKRWQAMMRRMKIQNLDRCLDVVKEVWDRRDHALFEDERRKARLATSSCQTENLPKTIMKRTYSPSGGIDPDSPGEGKPRATQSMIGSSSSTLKAGFLRRDSTCCCSGLDYELTVRGRQHWAGVMKDLRWEVLIG